MVHIASLAHWAIARYYSCRSEYRVTAAIKQNEDSDFWLGPGDPHRELRGRLRATTLLGSPDC